MTDEERFGLSGTRRPSGPVGLSDAVIEGPEPSQQQTSFSTTESRFGLPGSMTVFGSVGGVTVDESGIPVIEWDHEVVTYDIDFDNSAQEDIMISLGKEARLLLIGRLYIDQDPDGAFDEWTEYTFFSKSTKPGADAYHRNVVKLSYTELEVATTGTDSYIIPDDQTVFTEHNLARFIDDGELVRLREIADTMTAENTVGSHAIDTGLSRVSEFSGFILYNAEGGDLTYFRVMFDTAQTVSLRLELRLMK